MEFSYSIFGTDANALQLVQVTQQQDSAAGESQTEVEWSMYGEIGQHYLKEQVTVQMKQAHRVGTSFLTSLSFIQ